MPGPAGLSSAANDTGTQPTIVEGINAPWIFKKSPAVTINLTAGKENLAPAIGDNKKSEQNILPQSLIDQIGKKSNGHKIIFLVFAFLLILIVGGYEFYIQRLDRQNKIVPLNLFQRTREPVFRQPAGGTQTAATSSTADSANSGPSSTAPGIFSPSSTSPVIASPQPFSQQLKINETPTGYLNVRSQPSLIGEIISKVGPGQSYPFTQQQNGWYLITLPDKQQGWVSAEYVTVR